MCLQRRHCIYHLFPGSMPISYLIVFTAIQGMSGCKDSHNYDAQRNHFCHKHPWCPGYSVLISSDRPNLPSLLFLSSGFPAASGLLLCSELVLFTSNLCYIIHLEMPSLFLFASSNHTHPSWSCSGLTFSGKPFLITPAL